MMTKPTREPVHDDRIRFYVVSYGLCDVEKRICGIHDMAIGIECFALMFLSVRTDDQLGTGKFSFGVPLRVGKLGTELLDGYLKTCNLFALTTENQLGMLKPGSEKHAPCFRRALESSLLDILAFC